MDKKVIAILVILIIVILIVILLLCHRNFETHHAHHTNGTEMKLSTIAEHKPLQSSRKQMKYNIYKELDEYIEGPITTTNLLELSARKIPKVHTFAHILQEKFGVGNVVWEVSQNTSGKIRWEFYFYGMQKSLTPFQPKTELFKGVNNEHMKIDNFESSFNLSQVETDGLSLYSISDDKLTLFYVDEDELALPLQLTEHIVENDGSVKEVGVRRAFSTGCGQNLLDQALKAGISVANTKMMSDFVEQLNYSYGNAVVFRNQESVGIILNGLQTDNFIDFLIKNNHNKEVIELIESNKEHFDVEKEVAYYFDKNNGKLIKTGFFGIL